MLKLCNLSSFILEHGCWNAAIETSSSLDSYAGACLCGLGSHLIGAETGTCLLVVVNGY